MRLPSRIYHLAEASNWPSIRRSGLLPASELLTRAGVVGADRDRLERAQRREHTVLPDGVHIRDQRPMPPSALAGCLVGLAPDEWYALINRRVFFWLDPDRLNRQRAACALRPQVVLTVATAGLLAAHHDRIELSPINSGAAMRRAAKRGAGTFVRYAAWVDSGWAAEAAALGTAGRKRSHPPAELTVVGPVADVMRYVVRSTALGPGKVFEPSDADPSAAPDPTV
jgi:hypothetical protein